MSISSWDPSAEQKTKDFHIDIAQLSRFIALVKLDQLDQLQDLLSPDELQVQATLMLQSKESWHTVCKTFSDEDIISLMRFFTIAESLPGWHAGDQSPVIWLGKILKKRGSGINKELVLWIKTNSNNQFLPHGPLL